MVLSLAGQNTRANGTDTSRTVGTARYPANYILTAGKYKAPGKTNTKKRSKNCSTDMRIFPVAVAVVVGGGGGGVVICVVVFVFVFTVMLLLLLMCPTLTAVTRFITLSWSHAQKKTSFGRERV